MKKRQQSIFLILTALFAAFTLGLSLGRTRHASPITVSIPPSLQTLPTQTYPPETVPTETVVLYPINLNTADKDTLCKLPGIGEVLAARIIAYREANGPFQHPEELMNVEDIGEKRFEAILDLITIGG